MLLAFGPADGKLAVEVNRDEPMSGVIGNAGQCG
jgi:hypothetical protein